MARTDAVEAADEWNREARRREEPERERGADAAADAPGWETVAELPASAKLVARVLEQEGPLSGTALAEETRLPPRTVRYAVGRLEEADVVSEGFFLQDAREKRYRLRID